MQGAKTTGKPGKQDWQTPPQLFQLLDDILGPFALDVAANDENHLVDMYFTEKHNGLVASWTLGGSGLVFCNPPWSDAAAWVDKAIEEWMVNGVRTCMLLPASTDTEWFQILFRSAAVILLRGRVAYETADNQPSRPDRGSIVAVVGGNKDLVSVIDWRGLISVRDQEPYYTQICTQLRNQLLVPASQASPGTEILQ